VEEVVSGSVEEVGGGGPQDAVEAAGEELWKAGRVEGGGPKDGARLQKMRR
jgi:hypothetical protein